MQLSHQTRHAATGFWRVVLDQMPIRSGGGIFGPRLCSDIASVGAYIAAVSVLIKASLSRWVAGKEGVDVWLHKPLTRTPAPYTLPPTLNSQPSTHDPKPQTPHPKPQTPNYENPSLYTPGSMAGLRGAAASVTGMISRVTSSEHSVGDT
jgi:hypothetical protein